MTDTCQHCNEPLPAPKATGRRRRYCTDGCRYAAKEARRSAARAARRIDANDVQAAYAAEMAAAFGWNRVSGPGRRPADVVSGPGSFACVHHESEFRGRSTNSSADDSRASESLSRALLCSRDSESLSFRVAAPLDRPESGDASGEATASDHPEHGASVVVGEAKGDATLPYQEQVAATGGFEDQVGQGHAASALPRHLPVEPSKRLPPEDEARLQREQDYWDAAWAAANLDKQEEETVGR